jgi:carbon storage regulator
MQEWSDNLRQEVFPMLVLTRKKDEKIIVDDNIVITVLSIQGNRVRLGIDAPSGVPIRRKEIEVILDAPGEGE